MLAEAVVPADRRTLALGAVLLQTAIAVGTSFVAKALLTVIPAWPLVTLRLLGAALLMLGVLVVKRRSCLALPKRDLGYIALLGVLGVSINQACFLRGLSQTTPARSSLLYALTPLVVLLIGAVRRSERLSGARIAGLLLAFLGVALVLSQRAGLAGTSFTGDLIIIGGVLAWASYSALGKRVLERHDAVTVTAVASVVGCVAFLPFGVPTLAGFAWGDVPAWAWALMIYLVVLASGVAYIAWSVAIRHLPPSRVAVFMNLQPPLVVVIPWVCFGEPLTLVFILGATLVLLGVRLAGVPGS